MSLSIKGLPFSTLPRKIAFFKENRTRQRVGAFLIFSAPPCLLFLFWFFSGASSKISSENPNLYISILLAFVWIAIGPLAAQQAVFKAEEILDSYGSVPGVTRGKSDLIQERIDRIERYTYPVIVALGLIAGLAMAIAYPSLRNVVEIENIWENVAGIIVMGQAGLVAAVGLWGAVGAISTVSYAIKQIGVEWRPFHDAKSSLVDRTYARSQHMGVLVSGGSLFVPMLIVIQDKLNLFAVVVTRIFIALIPISGLVFFVILSVIVYRRAEEERRVRINSVADQIESCLLELGQQGSGGDPRAANIYYCLNGLLATRRELLAHNSLPPSLKLFTRSTLTLLIPSLVALARVVVEVF